MILKKVINDRLASTIEDMDDRLRTLYSNEYLKVEDVSRIKTYFSYLKSGVLSQFLMFGDVKLFHEGIERMITNVELEINTFILKRKNEKVQKVQNGFYSYKIKN